ncbi:MAG: hypothetical protein ACXVPL_05620 [Actinomycetota bacterium]
MIVVYMLVVDIVLAAEFALAGFAKANREATHGAAIGSRHREELLDPGDATQSGPMAPIDDDLDSMSQFIRGCIRYRESLDAQLPSASRIARVRPLTLRRKPRRFGARRTRGGYTPAIEQTEWPHSQRCSSCAGSPVC